MSWAKSLHQKLVSGFIVIVIQPQMYVVVNFFSLLFTVYECNWCAICTTCTDFVSSFIGDQSSSSECVRERSQPAFQAAVLLRLSHSHQQWILWVCAASKSALDHHRCIWEGWRGQVHVLIRLSIDCLHDWDARHTDIDILWICRGLGVIGEQPVLLPGTSFEYTSACPLRTATGRMVYTSQPFKTSTILLILRVHLRQGWTYANICQPCSSTMLIHRSFVNTPFDILSLCCVSIVSPPHSHC